MQKLYIIFSKIINKLFSKRQGFRITGLLNGCEDPNNLSPITIYKKGTILRKPPQTLPGMENSIFKEKSYEFNSSIIIKIKNGIAKGKNIITDTGKLIEYKYNFKNKNCGNILKNIQKRKKFNFPIGVVNHGDNSYYHWLFDNLPRIHLIKKSKCNWEKIYVSYEEKKYIRDSLALMNLSKENIIPKEKYPTIEASEMIIPFYDKDIILPWICTFLRDQFINETLTPKYKNFPERIFIYRKNTWRRSIRNANEVCEFLKNEYGFNIIESEKYTFSEQVELFNNAKIIIGPHGAGLSNIVFCGEKTKVIEIMGSNRIKNIFYNIAQNINIDYYYLIQRGINSKEFEKEIKENNLASDDEYIEINLNDLKNILRLANINKNY